MKTTGSSYTQGGQYLVRGHEIFLHFTSTGRAKWTGRTIRTTFTITSDPDVISDGVLKTYIKQARVGSVFPQSRPDGYVRAGRPKQAGKSPTLGQ